MLFHTCENRSCFPSNSLQPDEETTNIRWNLNFTLRSHFDCIRAMQFHPVEPVLITASEDGLAKLWNLGGGGKTDAKGSVLKLETLSFQKTCYHLFNSMHLFWSGLREISSEAVILAQNCQIVQCLCCSKLHFCTTLLFGLYDSSGQNVSHSPTFTEIEPTYTFRGHR